MIEIYLKTNTNYESNGDITLDPTSCNYKASENLLTLEHFIDDEGRWKYINFENVIAAEENGKKKLYRIYNVVKELYSVTAYARPIFFDLIDKVLLDVRPTQKIAQEALDIILEGTGFTGHSNLSSINTSYYIRKNIVESLIGDIENSFLNRWGGEFYCENFDVYINDRIGADDGVRVEFGYNLDEIEEDVNIEDVVTRIIPVGFDGIMLAGNAPWVDSSLINKYTHIKMRVITFSDVKVKENSEDEEGFETIEEARAELIRQCKLLFENGIDKPAVNYKIDMINLANTTAYKDFEMLVNVNKGDTVTCYIPHLGIDVKARVIDYEKDLLTGEYISIELGNVTNDFFKDQSDIQNKVDNIFNSNGNVKAETLEGAINALQTKFKALRDIAQPQKIRAILFEDRIEDSPTFGCMCLGTMGFEIASSFKPDTKEWDFRTFGTGQGFFADYIVAGTLNANLIKTGVLKSFNDKTWINMDDGTFNFGDKLKFNGTDMSYSGRIIAVTEEGNSAILEPIEVDGEIQFKMTLNGSGINSNFRIIDSTAKELFRVGHGGVSFKNNITFDTDQNGDYNGKCYWENGTYYPANDRKNLIGKNANSFYKVFAYKLGLDRTGAERYVDVEGPIIRLISSWGYGGIVADMQGYFFPEENNAWSFGKSDKRISTVYCTNINQPSDLKLKENVRYLLKNEIATLSSDSLSTEALYSFVKNDLKLAEFNYKIPDSREVEKINSIGFIAQDIKGTLVGEKIISEDKQGILSYDTATYINVLAGALQKAIEKIDLLEEKVKVLEGK